ncbi:nicotinate-nucleotide--dimethylbenzimidazole phosphoribosyltransferase [Aliikangiella marina]|uniref:Nicotinate-nucleotide--dimethylbenzimidazole phosphoribosyltransferase n=1 Tax=Aliikangiella marina TaxID=1712262 RepID=A0A545TCS0_9GAMM|nr:nicotinate-nucleotide--dimethylbenzimidazole phosphoribosyltransferase [Aliikangiella marina]TQV74991.1 nicotinate-nucleotide--dimethylbenzimidazole phosphoribosyltransferase [Aliikangiella marina]
MFQVKPLSFSDELYIQNRIDQKTKPIGALGKLENLAKQLALILGREKVNIQLPMMLIFAGDHGIASEGVSIAPSEVTAQMVTNFLNGGAAINCFCNSVGMTIQVIDCGIINSVNDERLMIQSLGQGTRNFSKEPAMSAEAVEEGLLLGARAARSQLEKGCNVFGFGEMGIGNTSSASALMAALLGLKVTDCVGRGTGIDDRQYQKKVSLIESALSIQGQFLEDPKGALAAYGGFEIVQMVGAMLAVAEAGGVIIVDGFISSVAALFAYKLANNTRDYMIFGHQSAEQGHQKLLSYLCAEPLLSLDLRLGEGTGAALALNLIHCAAAFYNDMASFESAGVTAV